MGIISGIAQCTNASYELPDSNFTFVNGSYGYDRFTTPAIDINVQGAFTNTGCKAPVVLAAGLEQFERNFKFVQPTIPANQNFLMQCNIYYIKNGVEISLYNGQAYEMYFVLPKGINKFYINTHITDKDACTNNSVGYNRDCTINYLGKSITENATVTNESGCIGNKNGSINIASIDAATGTAPYTYVWTSAVTGFTPPTTNVNQISSLSSGEYSCLISDSSNPIKTATKKYIIKSATNYDAYVTSNNTCNSYGLIIDPITKSIYNNDFNTNSNFSISDDAFFSGSDIRLITDQTSKTGKLILDNTPVLPSNFETSFRFKMLNKSGADGFSFNIGNDSFPGSAEDGVNQGLSIKFKIYNTDNVSMSWNGIQIGSAIDTPLETGDWIAVKLKVIDGKATLLVNGRVLFSDQTITGYAMNNLYKIIYKARTGGDSNQISIDDFNLGNSSFEYSIDGTTFQTANTFSNITLPTDRKIAIWLKQSGCAQKIRDYTFAKLFNFNFSNLPNTVVPLPECDPTDIRINMYNQDYRIPLFSTNFLTNDDYTIGLSAQKVSNGVLLTENKSNNSGYVIFNKLRTIDTGNRNFAIQVKQQSLNKSGADGFSINFGIPNPIINRTSNFEDGVTTGLAIRFKTNNNDLAQIFYNGVQIGVTVGNNGVFNLENGTENNIYISIVNSKITITHNGGALFTDVALPAAFATDDFSNYKLIIAARTGGGSNENLIKSVSAWDLSTFQASTDQLSYIDVDVSNTLVPINSSNIVNNKSKIYFKIKNGCPFDTFYEADTYKRPAAPTATSIQTVASGSTFADLAPIGTAGSVYIKWYPTATAVSADELQQNTVLTAGTTYYATQQFSISGCASPTTAVTVKFSGTLATDSFALGSKIKVYPNPTSGMINIDMKDLSFAKTTLYDLNGKVLKSQSSDSTSSKINISDLAKGIYLLKIDTNNGSITKQIIKD